MSIVCRASLAVSLLTVACAPSTPMPDLVISHVTVVGVEDGALLADRTVFIRAGRIERIDSTSEAWPGAEQLDGTGRFLMPGLWDMHVHLGGDSAVARQLLAWGITGARDMGGSEIEPALALRDRNARNTDGSRIVAAGLSLRGPRSASDSGPAVVRTAEDGRRAVDFLEARHADFIKVHEGLSRETWFAIARAARRRGLHLAGHVPANFTPGELADAGLRNISHLEFLPDRCLVLLDSTARANRTPPPGGCRPQELDQLLQHLQGREVWLDPTVGSFRRWAPRAFPSILAGFGDIAVLIRKNGLRILAGTDMSTPGFTPGASLHDELGLFVDAGFSTVEALRSATTNPAAFLGLSDSLGAVKAGYVADLLLLEGDPIADIRNTRRIAAVIRSGRIVPSVP